MKSAQDREPRTKIDELLPSYDVSACYGIEVAAPAEVVFQAIQQADFSDSLLVRALMSLRSGRLVRRGPPKPLAKRLRGAGFLELAAIPDRELVIGVVGKFWRPDGGRCFDLTAGGFRDFERQGYAKAAWNILLEPRADSTVVTTETRVQCLGAPARRKFKAYWVVVGPFSGLIRKAMLAQIKRAAESSFTGRRSRR